MIDASAGDPRILTTRQVAAMIRTSETWVVRNVARGAVPASRIGSEWRYWKPLVLARVLHAPVDITPGPPEPDVVTAAELAAKLTMAPHTVGKLIADGSIPAYKVGKGWRIHWPTVRGRLERGEPFDPGDYPTGPPPPRVIRCRMCDTVIHKVDPVMIGDLGWRDEQDNRWCPKREFPNGSHAEHLE